MQSCNLFSMFASITSSSRIDKKTQENVQISILFPDVRFFFPSSSPGLFPLSLQPRPVPRFPRLALSFQVNRKVPNARGRAPTCVPERKYKDTRLGIGHTSYKSPSTPFVTNSPQTTLIINQHVPVSLPSDRFQLTFFRSIFD